MKISILGLGAYGIALGKAFLENDNKVSIWTKFEEEADIVKLKRENINCLPGVKIPKVIDITTDMKQCVEGAKIVVIAVPSFALRQTSKQLSEYITSEQVICIASKGIEKDTYKLMSQVVEEEINSEHVAMLSGPTFAVELVGGSEIGLTVASKSSIARTAVKICLENDRIKVGMSCDIEGVQIASTAKNIFAILMGMMEGMKKSDSDKAAVMSVLTNDLRVLIEIFGGKYQTVFTFAGIGDLLLTCTSKKSRNYQFGILIGKGNNKEEALKIMQTSTIEGIGSLEALKKLLYEKEIKMKSIDFIYDVVYNGGKPEHILSKIK